MSNGLHLMTLIASFEYQHTPVLLGDVLITSPASPSIKEASAPLVHSPNRILGISSQRHVTSLRQKVAILHDQVCLAWTGSLFHVQRFAEYVRSFLVSRSSIGYDELRLAIDKYPRKDIEGHFDFIIYVWHGSGWSYFSTLMPFDLDPLSQVRVGGTGTEHFISKIEQIAKSPIGGEQNPYSELATRALAYASLASAQQHFGGVGIDQWWGGAFEVVVRRDDQFAKLGPISWLYWEGCELAEKHFSIELKPAFIYQFYVGDTAMFWTDEEATGANKLHAIGPPFSVRDEPLQRPDSFETDIVVNLMRLNRLNGETYDGCNVDIAGNVDGRDLIIRWSKGENKTTLGIREGLFQRMFRFMPLSNDAIIDVKFWGKELQFRSNQVDR